MQRNGFDWFKHFNRWNKGEGKCFSQTKQELRAIEKEIDKILRESIETDEHEDEIYGDSTPYRMPEELVDKKYRLEFN